MANLNTKSLPVAYVFIDATNIIYGATKYGWRVDFKKLIKYLKDRYSTSRVFYYAGIDKDNQKQIHFYEIIKGLGYELKLVPVKTFSDGRKKADVDSKMTFEMMLYFNEYEQVVVLTGDGDYYWVLEYLQKQKQQVIVMSFPKQTAHEIKALVGSNFANLDNLKHLIEYK